MASSAVNEGCVTRYCSALATNVSTRGSDRAGAVAADWDARDGASKSREASRTSTGPPVFHEVTREGFSRLFLKQ